MNKFNVLDDGLIVNKISKTFDKKTIVLVGHMGCGKSTIGRIFSKKLKWEF